MEEYRMIYTVDTVSQLQYLNKTDDAMAVVSDKVLGGLFYYTTSNYSINNGLDIFNGWTKADNIETVLKRLKTVDGKGSGLDADLLDGIDSTAFSQLAANETVSGSKTWSNATLNTPNLPTADPKVVGQWWNNSGALTISAG